MYPRPRLLFSPSVFSGVFICRYSEHQFDIRDPVGFVFVSCVPCDGVILRLSCVVYFSTVEKADGSYGTSPGVLKI